MNSRNYNIDILKIISCIAVVGLHTFCGTDNIIWNLMYLLCGYAIPLFLFCSGFLILPKNDFSYKDSIKKIYKVSKIILLWVAISVFIKIIIITSSCENVDYFFWIKVIFSPFINEGLLWHFWYMITLMILYLFLPILFKFKKNNLIINLWIVFFVFSILLQFVSIFYKDSIQTRIPQYLRIWSWLQYFLLGYMIQTKVTNIKRKMNILNIDIFKFAFVAIIVLFINLFYQYYMLNCIFNNNLAEVFYDDLFEIVCITIISIFILTIKISDILVNLINSIAPLTFGVYIIHPFVMKFTKIISINIPVVWWIETVIVSFFIIYIMFKFPKLKYLVAF